MDAERDLDYGYLMQKAMRSVMAEVLERVAASGLPGAHHFYITFDTGHPGVDMPDSLRRSYPDEMTIMLQGWFENLTVTTDRFSVTLNFSNQAETIVVPFAAVRTFVDPSVKFGLKFDAQDPGDGSSASMGAAADEAGMSEGAERDGADIVSLDHFRKP